MMDVGSLNALMSHDGVRKALHGFAPPVYALLGLICLVAASGAALFTRQPGGAEFLAFLRPLLLAFAGIFWTGILLPGIFVFNLSLPGLRADAGAQETRWVLLQIAVLFFPIALLFSYIAVASTPGHGAIVFRLGEVVWTVYLSVGVGFSVVQGVRNLCDMVGKK